ncbi:MULTISPECIES: ASCH domain-containing protein [Haloarcula]|jgi:hypothetical protein|uniref:ASCH domain-containing protein n=1 Tax=Haloarcula marismortui ATCC 33800 TaxID=662476 RepID=M0JI36_9EURY|nr:MULTISPECIES: ASCH domain-containing protein [Haloarcula]EMA08792.1 hypothetical protein C436_20313 [Haloarcula sinaiiensis ATCC 33800]NHX41685.1 ASCH domain-containing protein [Haloarcula sp. R1-2]QUJ74055.1 ASCH domain-containing protein [Haloarcula sinaiiensis ATCC 33800]
MTLLFKPRHIAAIRDGTKTATRRDWADNYPRPSEGDIRMAVTEMFTSDEACDCYLRITNLYQEPLGEMSHEDARKEGGYDMAEFRKAWTQINGDWDPELVVDVVEFEYVGRERPSKSAASGA